MSAPGGDDSATVDLQAHLPQICATNQVSAHANRVGGKSISVAPVLDDQLNWLGATPTGPRTRIPGTNASDRGTHGSLPLGQDSHLSKPLDDNGDNSVKV